MKTEQKTLSVIVLSMLTLVLVVYGSNSLQPWCNWRVEAAASNLNLRVPLLKALRLVGSRSRPAIWDLCRYMPVIVVGQATDFSVAKGVQVYSQNTSRVSSIRILHIQVENVLKGMELVSPGADLEAVIIPTIVEYGTLPPGVSDRQLFEAYQKTGELPTFPFKRKENYPEIPLHRPVIFFLSQVTPDNPRFEWAGLKENYGGKVFWNYIESHPVGADGIEVKLVRRFLGIDQIKDQDRRDQEELKFSLNLVRDRGTPIQMAVDAALFFGVLRVDPKTDKSVALGNRLTKREINELTEIATDTTRDAEIRVQLLHVLLSDMYEFGGRVVRVAPFLRMVQNSSEALDMRLHLIQLLEKLNTAEVRNGFRAILATEAKTEEDQQVWERLRQSALLGGGERKRAP